MENMMSVSKRKCDGCTLCCEGWLSGEVMGKPFYSGRPCHFLGTNRCTIYETRPEHPCKVFTCGWLNDDEMFPEWMKPTLTKIIAHRQKTINGFLYYKIYECGQKIDSKVLNYLILYSLNNSVNIRVQVDGGWTNYGSQDFLKDI
jgi:hypothetical protein